LEDEHAVREPATVEDTAAPSGDGACTLASALPAHQPDYFVERDGVRFAGTHLLLDLWGAAGLDDRSKIETALREASAAAGATLLHIHLHSFTDSGGISGVAVLAESHISIHTWPERDFAAIDIFMCGNCDPYRSVEVLKRNLKPRNVQLVEQRRGLGD
jgi:S-adenosylmethionine decarboxylase